MFDDPAHISLDEWVFNTEGENPCSNDLSRNANVLLSGSSPLLC